jgi:hypothetical protein
MNLLREKRTIAIMIYLYCHHHHGKGETICAYCSPLHEYAIRRIDSCKFGADKPVCAKCTVHCYKADMRQQIRQVMRYAGPRMLVKHPYLAICHLVDSWRKR